MAGLEDVEAGATAAAAAGAECAGVSEQRR